MEGKPFWQSKTLWANVLMLGIAIVDGTYGVTGIPQQYLVYITLGLNVALRFLTGQPLSGGK